MANKSNLMSESDDGQGDAEGGHLQDSGIANVPQGQSGRPGKTREQVPELVVVETDSEFNPLHADQGAAPPTPPTELEHEEPAVPGESEEARQTRRSESSERRQRQKQAKERSSETIRYMESRIAELETQISGRLGHVDQQLTQFDQQQREEAFRRADFEVRRQGELATAARQELAAAMAAGDSTAMGHALDKRDAAIMAGQQAFVRANMLKSGQPIGDGRQPQRPQGQPQVQQPQRQAAPPLPRQVQEHIDSFQDRHPWYDPQDPQSFDSKIVLELDKAIADDGFRPSSQDYWDELEDRMKQYLPGRFKQEGAPRQRQQARQAQQPQIRGPQIGAPADRGAPRLQSNQVMISPERKTALISTGALAEDGKTVLDRNKYNRYLTQYAQYDRANGVAR